MKLIETKNGVETYRFYGKNGAYVDVITYGARIHRLCVPDKNGVLRNIVAGFNEVDEYFGENPYFNATIGRVSNRIRGARFTYGGKEYKLNPNEAPNHLHGGTEGFDRKIFKAKEVGDKLELTYTSPDGEENYPGTFSLKVTYSFDENNSLLIEFEGATDADTPVSITNHAYFNLSGDFKNKVFDTVMYINAHKTTTYGEDLLITGAIDDVTGTPYDFQKPHAIGERMFEDVSPLKAIGGYDTNYILHDGKVAAVAYSPISGIRLTVGCDSPCLQFYSGNLLYGLVGRDVYLRHTAFCLEPQMYPDSVNVSAFPSSILKPGERYHRYIRYSFDVVE